MIEGLYIHVPFCHYKCFYCDFVSFVLEPQEEYLDLILKEIQLYSDLEFSLRTVYFGGGTPSLIKPSWYKSFFEKLSKLVDLSRVVEVSIECNPEDYSYDDYRELLDIGFNRLSIGAQSFTKKGLSALGRRHEPSDVIKAVEQAHKAGFENISVDIIYGYEGQTLKDLEEDINFVLSLPVKHASFYMLTPYEDTILGHMYSEGRISLPDADLLADMFMTISERLSAFGFVHYEISNYALPGYECKHNILYWTHGEFLGLGVSAWSFAKNVRWGNTKNINLYRQKILEGERPIYQREVLEGKELVKDYLFVALRTSLGVPEDYKTYIPEELMEFFVHEGGRIRLTERGMLLFNSIYEKIATGL